MPRPLSSQPDLDAGARIEIAYLKANGYLKGYKSGEVAWYIGSTRTGKVNITVDVRSENPGMTLSYSFQGKSINHFVPLVRVPSNLGKGFVWLFLCPITQKHCRILYENGKHFTHREAVKGGMYSCQSIQKSLLNTKKAYALTDGKKSLAKRITGKYFRATYRGKPTKTFLKWQRDFERLQRLR
jgi:hypothetical protein